MGNFFKTTVIGVACSIITAAPGWAAPIYTASIDAELSLVSTSISDGAGDLDFTIEGESILIDADAFSDGDATSGYSETLSPALPTSLTVEPVSVQLSADGSATGIGSGDSFSLGDSIITIFNNSTTNTIKLDFVLDYAVLALAQVDDALMQYATAATFFSMQSSQDFDPLLEFDLLADTDIPGSGSSFSDIFQFSLFIAPESEASIFLQSDVSGFLTSELEAPLSEVPLPSMAGLFALSALGFGFKSRRKSALKSA